jgi:phage terminase small subunit
MAGVKGKSGGKRPGAGRKPAQARGAKPKSSAAGEVPAGGDCVADAKSPLDDAVKREPLEFLELVMNDPTAPLKERIRAGVAAAQYRHTKRGDGGKKEEAAGKAAKAATGRFGPRKPPLALVNGGR